MKHGFILFAAAALAMVACDKNNGKEETKPLEADMTMTVTEIVYGEPANLEGTITSTVAIDEMVVTAVKKSGEKYTAVGEAQPFAKPEAEYKAIEYFADSQELTDLEITLKAGKAAKTFYFPVTVTGEPKGDFWMNDAAAIYPDNKVLNHENDPETYPEEFTGAGSDTKSFFSMHGVDVNGKLEHIVSLNDLLAVDGKNGSFCFLNVLENTSKKPEEKAYIGSQRGYMFSTLKKSQLGGGTTGRQCDLYQYGAHQIKDENVDINFTMTYVRGSWSDAWHEDIYKSVDAIFMSIEKAETKLEKIKAYWKLGEIQRKMDNATLGEEDEPTNLGGKAYVRKWVNAGHTSTSALEEVLRAGDYIVFRSERKEGDESKYYYGIMQIMQFVGDDSKCFVEVEGKGQRMDAELTYDLFMKPVYLNIKTQCELR
ncbi:MAG: hypothetical protein ACI3ZQ_00225 [Candidatus Cryptobacteroides sp.]